MSSRREQYLHYLAFGGDLRDLPAPVAPEDEYLYRACVEGTNLPKKVDSYYECTLNSDSEAYNFVSGILDLGDKRVTTAKVRFRFKLEGTVLPSNLFINLFANNSSNRNDITGYILGNLSQNNTINTTTEYVLETSYIPKSGTDLNTCRYLKPFLGLSKTGGSDGGRTVIHKLKLYEISIEIDGVIYDITDTVSDFAEKTGSNIKFIQSKLSKNAANIRTNSWFGKTVACLGDSITFGMKSGQGNQTVSEANPWVTQLKSYCGFLNARNYGISGSEVSKFTTSKQDSMYDRVAQVPADSDVVIFMGGINDLANGATLGNFVPENETFGQVALSANNTYYGALQYIARDLKKRFLDNGKKVVFMPILNTTNTNVNMGVSNKTQLTIAQFNEAVKTVADHYGFNFFDLQKAVKFDGYNDPDNTYFAANDKLHPNQNGHDEIARALSQYINSLA